MRFLDYAGHRQDAIICPRCGSHPRHRMLWIYLTDQIKKLTSGSAVLHLSAEQNMRSLFASRPDLRYVTTDLKLKDSTVLADATRMPFRSGTFQMIVTSHVLEHIEHDRAALAEFDRILAPGGQAIIMVPTVPNWRGEPTREFGMADPRVQGHWRMYGFDFTQRARAAGLVCAGVGASELLSSDTLEQCALMDDAIFVAQKRR
jgi:SAM-dependent methyltransferase